MSSGVGEDVCTGRRDDWKYIRLKMVGAVDGGRSEKQTHEHLCNFLGVFWVTSDIIVTYYPACGALVPLCNWAHNLSTGACYGNHIEKQDG